MKATELMIDDWILVDGIPSQVKGVDNNGQITYSHPYTEVLFTTYDFEPLPITSEILEKNGFEHYNEGERNCCEGYYYDKNYKNDKLENLLYGDGDTWGCIWGRRLYDEYICYDINIHCVSELQHLLRVLNVEELINNFKV